MEPPYLDEVDVYIRHGADPGQPQDYRRISVGDHTPMAAQPLPTALMTAPLLIEPDASLHIVIRVHSYSAHNMAAQLVSPQQLLAKTARHLVASKQQAEKSLNSERRIRDEQGRFIYTISHEYRSLGPGPLPGAAHCPRPRRRGYPCHRPHRSLHHYPEIAFFHGDRDR